jgi:DNA-binding CsgD family transcriptional regulator/tetratricopeptide (TPR) repeat protein
MYVPERVLRGRDEELELLNAAVHATEEGSGSLVLIEGMAGIGKSVLIDEVVRAARRSKCRVATGRADELDQITPMGALLSGLCTGPRPLVTSDDLGGAPMGDQRMWMLDRLTAVLESEASRRPLVITVDDLQWADQATWLAVRALPERLFTLPILWVLARRPNPSPAPLAAAWRRLADGAAAVLHLGPIDGEAVAALTADLVGFPPSRELTRELSRAGGNPFYVAQLLHRFAESGALDISTGAARLRRGPPTGEVGALLPHLGSLSPEARRLVGIGAVLGQRFPLDVAAAMLGQPAGALVGAVAECREAQVLEDANDSLAFRHDLLREAAYAELPEPVRVALHRDAARILTAQGASSLEVAPHLARGARPGDAAAVIGLRSAATELLGTNPSAAADLALRAHELTPREDPGRAATGAAAVDALGWAGRLGEAEALGQQIRLEGGLDPVSEATIEIGIRRSWRQSVSRAYERPVPDRLVNDPLVPATLRISLLSFGRSSSTEDDSSDSARRMASLRAEAEASGDASGANLAVSDTWEAQVVTDTFQGRLTEALAGARAAVAWATERGLARWGRGFVFCLAHVLLALDRFDEAMETFQAADRGAQAIGATAIITMNEAMRGTAFLAAGRLDDAAAAAESARQMAEDFGLAWLWAVSSVVLGEVAFTQGDMAGAAAHAELVEPLVQDRTAPPETAWLSALLADAEGHPRRAVVALERAMETLLDGDYRLVIHKAERFPQLVSICRRAGRADLATAVSDRAAALAALNPTTSSFSGVAAHSRGLLERDGAMLAEAVQLLRGCSRPLALAAALEDAGAAKAAAGDDRQAVAELSEAYDISVGCDAHRVAARLRRELRSVGVVKRAAAVARPAVGWESLTEAEIAVVRLVAGGASSRAVAERLFLSVNTVNTHLRHVFTKLGIRSRVELARVVFQHDQGDGGGRVTT